MVESHNVFVSHRHEDDAYVGEFKRLMSDHGIEIRDSSITNTTPNQAKDPDYIKREILAPRIRWAGKIVVLITPDTKNHEFVDWEIDYANKQEGPKRIIGVWVPGSDGCELPEALARHADAVVTWDYSEILSAIEGRNTWENPDGTPREIQPMTTIPC